MAPIFMWKQLMAVMSGFEPRMTKDETLNAIARDIEACRIALIFAKGRARKKFNDHLEACFAEIKRINPVSPEIESMTDEQLLAELFS
jgi:hypothetical protein